ncbi:epidermal growth factor-like protein 7 [Liolophura sinensis]|uniref:epidermal growth factor-like protein 7 n=1 Tax=Liolophura sinensis TaxID=3198878 RepID=UPI00315912F2
MRLFVVIFCLLACLSVKALSPSGQNVCRHTRIESYTAQERYYTKCGWFNWRRCTRHRRVVRTRTAVDYRCCSGWNSADNIHCKRAICTGSAPGTCPNGGVCVRPTVCSCRRGFGQPNCADTNECLSGNGGCEHQCENTKGSFRCRCSSGYRLAEDGKACAGKSAIGKKREKIFDHTICPHFYYISLCLYQTAVYRPTSGEALVQSVFG